MSVIDAIYNLFGWCRHDWNKWEKPAGGFQHRSCKKCGVSRVRME